MAKSYIVPHYGKLACEVSGRKDLPRLEIHTPGKKAPTVVDVLALAQGIEAATGWKMSRVIQSYISTSPVTRDPTPALPRTKRKAVRKNTGHKNAPKVAKL